MAWNDLEKKVNRAGQYVTEAGQSFLKDNVDEPMAAKLAALEQASKQAQAMQAERAFKERALAMPPPPMANAALMKAENSGHHLLMGGEPMPQMPVQREAPEELNPANYKTFKTTAQKMAEANAAPQPRFDALKKKIDLGKPIEKKDIRETLTGAVEVTPELEAQLGYGQPLEEKGLLSEEDLKAFKAARNP
jgi:hypothetical protein